MSHFVLEDDPNFSYERKHQPEPPPPTLADGLCGLAIGIIAAIEAAEPISGSRCRYCEGTGTGNFACPHCHGFGSTHGIKCFLCKGRGISECMQCWGSGVTR